jgi:hypothetical protein
VADLSDADAGAGKEIEETPGFIALRLNQKLLSLAMAEVVERGGEELVFLRIGFEKADLGPQGAMEAEANLERFAGELGTGHDGLGNIFVVG